MHVSIKQIRLRSFGRIQIRIYDPRSLRSWRTKGTELWFVGSVTMTIGAKSDLKNNQNVRQNSKRSLKQTSKLISSNNISSNVTKQAVPSWRLQLHAQVFGD